jgi:hypothetical protein
MFRKILIITNFSRRHNYLRITRILKCLGDMNLEKFQIGWIEFLVNEIFVDGELSVLDSSMANFWVHTIRNDVKRNEMINNIENLAINKLKESF